MKTWWLVYYSNLDSKFKKSFLRAIQNIAKVLPKHLKKRTEWDSWKKKVERKWTERKEEKNNELGKNLTEKSRLAYFVRDRDKIVTTDTSWTGLGIPLWRKQNSKTIQPIVSASRPSNNARKKHVIGELKFLAAVIELKKSGFYLYGKLLYIYTNHQAWEPLFKQNRAHQKYRARVTRWLQTSTLRYLDNEYCWKPYGILKLISNRRSSNRGKICRRTCQQQLQNFSN